MFVQSFKSVSMVPRLKTCRYDACIICRSCHMTQGDRRSTRSTTARVASWIPVTSKQAILRGIAPDGGLYVADGLGQTRNWTLRPSVAQGLHAGIGPRRCSGMLLPDYAADEVAACVEAAYGSQWRGTPAVDAGDPARRGLAARALPWPHERLQGRCPADATAAHERGARGRRPGRDDRHRHLRRHRQGGPGRLCRRARTPASPSSTPRARSPTSSTSRWPPRPVTTWPLLPSAATSTTPKARSSPSLPTRPSPSAWPRTGVTLSSANSINVGRLAPQVTYYFDAYAQLVRAGAVKAWGRRSTFCVPTGNFGDVLAGYYAKLLGLPVARLVVASNKNDVLTDFITTGAYDRRRDFAKTISPSMDILVSSNLERLLYYMSDGDCELVASLMADLGEKGSYQVPEGLLAKIQEVFAAGAPTTTQRAPRLPPPGTSWACSLTRTQPWPRACWTPCRQTAPCACASPQQARTSSAPTCWPHWGRTPPA